MRGGLRLAVGALVLAGLLSACGGTSRHAVVTLVPQSATLDVPFDVHISGLPARAPVTIAFSGRSADGKLWQGSRAARADGRGDVILSDQYLFAQMQHPGGVDVPFPAVVRVTAHGGGLVASATARRYAATSLPMLTTFFYNLKKLGFIASWVRPRGVRDHTAILLFGGSEGGLGGTDLAAALAAHGYPVLNLAYFGLLGLPPTLERIPLEYFQRALRWLAAQPQVEPKRIVTIGISRGGELSLILASTFPNLVHGAVGYVPYFEAVGSPVNPTAPAWTYHGKPVFGTIPVEKINGPVFVAGSDKDGLWRSGLAVRMIARRMHEHGRHDVTALDYRAAGHYLGSMLPLQVIASAKGYGLFPSQYGPIKLGGSPRADENAREDAWPKLLRFLSRIPQPD